MPGDSNTSCCDRSQVCYTNELHCSSLARCWGGGDCELLQHWAAEPGGEPCEADHLGPAEPGDQPAGHPLTQGAAGVGGPLHLDTPATQRRGHALPQRISIFRDRTRNVAGKMRYYADFFLFGQCNTGQHGGGVWDIFPSENSQPFLSLSFPELWSWQDCFYIRYETNYCDII